MYRVADITSAGGKMIIKLEISDGYSDEAVFTVGREFCPFEIEMGDEISEMEMSRLEEAHLITEAFEKALNALSYTPHSKVSLAGKLTTKYKIEKNYAETAASYCAVRGYIDEESQAKRIAENCQRSKNYGPRRIAAELISKGYEKKAVQSALDSISEGVHDAAYRALLRKTKAYPVDRETGAKIKAALTRMGHSPSVIETAFETLREQEDE